MALGGEHGVTAGWCHCSMVSLQVQEQAAHKLPKGGHHCFTVLTAVTPRFQSQSIRELNTCWIEQWALGVVDWGGNDTLSFSY